MRKIQPSDVSDLGNDDYLLPYAVWEAFDANRPRRKSSRCFTERKLDQVLRWIKEGRGQGRAELYKPWIKITRGFSSPVSYQILAQLGVHKRNHHLLSQLEYHTGLCLAYLGATEIRECLPMWPGEHANPLHTNGEARTAGLLEIAKAANIEHGNFIGCDVPYIASLDFLVSLHWREKPIYLGISCKPKFIMQTSIRANERVKLDELYCAEIGALHRHVDGTWFNPVLIKNLEAFRPRKSELDEVRDQPQFLEFCNYFNDLADSYPIHWAITESGRLTGVKHMADTAMWRVGVWLNLIDVDLGERVSMLRPAKRGGVECREKIARPFIGDKP